MILKTKNKRLFKSNYNKNLYSIIEKFIFQLQHRIYKHEKKKNKQNILKLKYIFTKSWSLFVFSRLLSYQLKKLKTYQNNNNITEKNVRYYLLPEHLLTLLILEPTWEGKFEPNTFGSRPGFKTYNAISVICKNLKKKKYHILKFELYVEINLKILISLTHKKTQSKVFMTKNLKYKKLPELYKKRFLINSKVFSFSSFIQFNFRKKNLNVIFPLNVFNYNSIKFLYLNNLNSYVTTNSLYYNSESFNGNSSFCNFQLNSNNNDLKNLEIKKKKIFWAYKSIFLSETNLLNNKHFSINPYNCTEFIFNFCFYNTILYIENVKHLTNSEKIKTKKLFIFETKIYKQKQLNLQVNETKKQINQKKSVINLKKYNSLNQLSKFLQKLYISKNYNLILLQIKKISQVNYFDTKMSKILIFRHFVDYWFNKLYKYLFFIENSNNKIVKFFHFNYLKKNNWNIISLRLNSTFPFKLIYGKINYPEIIQQQYYFLLFDKLKNNIDLKSFINQYLCDNEEFSTLNLKFSFQNNFSSFSNNFFTTQLKKNILKFLKTNKAFPKTKNLFIQSNRIQKKYIEKNIIKYDQFFYTINQCWKIKFLMSRKNYFSEFSFVNKYKYSSLKFVNQNLHSLYLTQLTSNQLCGFFINILLAGIEYDFYKWIDVKKKLNFKKSGYFLKYGTQIFLMHPNFKNLKISEQFLKIWSLSKNIKLNIFTKDYSYSLNTGKITFLEKKNNLVLNQVSRVFKKNLVLKKQTLGKKVFTNYFGTQKFIYKEFLLNSKKFIFLESYGSFLLQNFFKNLESFLLLKLYITKLILCFKLIDLKSAKLFFLACFHENKLKSLEKYSVLGHLSSLSLKKNKHPSDFINLSFGKLSHKKNKQSLTFLGFDIYQFKVFNKFFFEILILPSKFAIKSHLTQLKKIIQKNSTKKQKNLIQTLSPIIRIWSEYYNIVTTKKIHRYCDYILLRLLWKWACKRHSKKSKKWIKSKYFHSLNGKNWVFGVYNKFENSFYCLPNHIDISLTKLSVFDTFFSVFNFEIMV